MFRSALFNTEAIRRKGKAEEGKEKKEEEDHKTAKAKQGVNGKPKGIITSSAEPDRKPDEKYVLWCQKKGPIGWVIGIVGVGCFTGATLVVGGFLGWCCGQGIVLSLDQLGLLTKIKDVLHSIDNY